MTDRDFIAAIIRQVADRSGLSNAEIARRAGISKSTITEAIRGIYSVRVETLKVIVEACGFELNIAIRSENPPTSQIFSTNTSQS